MYAFPVSLTFFDKLAGLRAYKTILTDIYDLKGEKITCIFADFLVLFFKMESPVSIAEAHTALLSMREVRASHPSCIVRSQPVLLSMRAVRASHPRMHF